MAYEPIATGKVASLSLNGQPVNSLSFNLDGPEGDTHTGFARKLSGHDSDYIRTSNLGRGAPVFNWRTWTALSHEEVSSVEQELGVNIPQGCLLENIVFEGIPNFSELPPTSRIVFPSYPRLANPPISQAILALWEKNGPCRTVGERLANHYDDIALMTKFVTAAKDKRGVMGFVLSAGTVYVGDTVHIYPPA